MKVSGPLFSLEAHGTVGKVLTFSRRASGQQVRFQRKQKDTNSVSQQAQRSAFEQASLLCRNFDYGGAIFGFSKFSLSPTLFEDEAEKKHMSGYNFCIAKELA